MSVSTEIVIFVLYPTGHIGIYGNSDNSLGCVFSGFISSLEHIRNSGDQSDQYSQHVRTRTVIGGTASMIGL